jgi:hypothetical protein
MDTSTWIAFVGAVLGSGGISALGGYLLAGRNERKRDERAAEREREARREKQADEARTFQRDTLLELHDQLYKLNRHQGKIQHIDEMRYRETGRYKRGTMPGGLSDGFTELVTNINRLRVRVFDPELREAIDKYMSMVISLIFGSALREEGDDAEQHTRAGRIDIDITNQYPELEEQLGAAIRSQFPGSDLAPSAQPGSGAASLPAHSGQSLRRIFRKRQ